MSFLPLSEDAYNEMRDERWNALAAEHDYQMEAHAGEWGNCPHCGARWYIDPYDHACFNMDNDDKPDEVDLADNNDD